MGVKPGAGPVPHPGAQLSIPNGGVMEEHEKGEISPQAIYGGIADRGKIIAGKFADPPDRQEGDHQQEQRGQNAHGTK